MDPTLPRGRATAIERMIAIGGNSAHSRRNPKRLRIPGNESRGDEKRSRRIAALAARGFGPARGPSDFHMRG